MRILGFNFNKQKATEKKTFTIQYNNSEAELVYTNFNEEKYKMTVANSTSSKYVELSNKFYYTELEDLVKQSPTQWAIIQKKIKLQSGDGFLFNDLNKEESNLFKINNTDLNAWLRVNDINNLIRSISYNWQVFGNIYLKLSYDLETHSKIVAVESLSPKNVRIGKKEDNKIKNYYVGEFESKNISKNYNEIAAFDENNKEAYTQMLHIKNGNCEYYGEPLYYSCLKSICAEVCLEIFKLKIVKDGYYPMLHVNFPNELSSEEHTKRANSFKNNFGGVKNAATALITQSNGNENIITVNPIQPVDLDKTFTVTKDSVIQSILTANEITSVELMGINVPGKLGTSDLDVAFELFNSWSVGYDRRLIEEQIFYILNSNFKNIISFKLNVFNPLGNIQTEKNNNGDTNIKEEEQNNKNNFLDKNQNELKNTVGGVQSIIQLQESVSKGSTDYNSAIQILIIIYGFTFEEAKKILGTPKPIENSKNEIQ